MRNEFASALFSAASVDDRICIVVADISPAGAMEEFRETFPDRFINVGVAEQAMIGVSAGLALQGLLPFAYTIAAFAVYRPFEFIRDDLAYQRLPVTVVGVGGGLSYSTLGGTHHTQEDVAVMSAIPGMSVMAPCDPPGVRDAVDYLVSCERTGPVYLRIGKAGEPNISFGAEEPFRFARLRRIRSGTGGLAIISYGPVMKLVLDSLDGLAAQGLDPTVVESPTLKPIDEQGIRHLLESNQRLVVLEEHVSHGGLATQVKSIALDSGATCQIRSLTLKDNFIKHYGSYESLLRLHGISVHEIVLACSDV